MEKQISLVACKDEAFFRVHSDAASVTRKLLAHPSFNEERRREVNGQVVSVTRTLPVRFVSIGAAGRSGDAWNRLVSGGVFDG